jgi:hypothetical protein
MRQVKHLSPSSFMKFEADPEDFVKTYLIEPAPPMEPASIHMSLGSAFDAYVKHALVKHIHGAEEVAQGSPFHLETLFEKQVSKEHQDWAWIEGKRLYDVYVSSGAFEDLLKELDAREGDVAFEKECYGPVALHGGREVVLKGFPDCWYVNRFGKLVILDWKCMGYKSRQKQSPKKYYVSLRPGSSHHKKIVPVEKYGLRVQDQFCFSETDGKWAVQLSMYSWMLGRPIGDDTVMQIEQLLMEPDSPEVRVVTYRGFTTEAYQHDLAERIVKAWDAIQSGHVFQYMSLEQSQEKLRLMEKRAAMELTDNPVLKILKALRP